MYVIYLYVFILSVFLVFHFSNPSLTFNSIQFVHLYSTVSLLYTDSKRCLGSWRKPKFSEETTLLGKPETCVPTLTNSEKWDVYITLPNSPRRSHIRDRNQTRLLQNI